MAALATAIHITPVGKETMKDDKSAGGNLEGNESLGRLGHRCGVQDLECGAIIGGIADEALA